MSRRHILRLKKAQGLETAKYSLLQFLQSPKVGPNFYSSLPWPNDPIDTLKFRRTLFHYFSQFVWIEKKRHY